MDIQTHEKYMSNCKLVLNFDLDETLIKSFKHYENPSKLSDSAEIELSKSSDGVLYDHTLVDNPMRQYTPEKICALSRKSYSELFKKIEIVNTLAPGSIAVNILTNSLYENARITKVLKKFFGYDDIHLYNNQHRPYA